MGRLLWRVMPALVVIWAIRTGTVNLSATFSKARVQIYAYKTGLDLSSIAKQLEAEYRDEGALPHPSNFSGWLTKHVSSPSGNAAHDVFGNPLVLEMTRDGFVLRSRGPDCRLNTADDIIERRDTAFATAGTR